MFNTRCIWTRYRLAFTYVRAVLPLVVGTYWARWACTFKKEVSGAVVAQLVHLAAGAGEHLFGLSPSVRTFQVGVVCCHHGLVQHLMGHAHDGRPLLSGQGQQLHGGTRRSLRNLRNITDA